MKKSGFSIPIEEIATKAYVTDKVDQKFNIFMEKVDDGFKIVAENQHGLAEHLERFELETGRRFKFINNRLDSITIDLSNLDEKLHGFQTETKTNFELVIHEIRELKEKIER